MRTGVIHRLPAKTPEIGVQRRTRGVKSDPSRRPLKFKAVAPQLFGGKVAAAIATIRSIENCSPSTAKRMLKGEPSLRVWLAAALEMLKPLED